MEVGKNAVSEAKRKSMEGFTPGGGRFSPVGHARSGGQTPTFSGAACACSSGSLQDGQVASRHQCGPEPLQVGAAEGPGSVEDARAEEGASTGDERQYRSVRKKARESGGGGDSDAPRRHVTLSSTDGALDECVGNGTEGSGLGRRRGGAEGPLRTRASA